MTTRSKSLRELVSSGKTLIDLDDLEKYGDAKAYINGQGYVKIRFASKDKQQTLSRLIMDTPKHLVVDHINRIKTDNRKNNLRNCSRLANSLNTIDHPMKGVNYLEKTKRYVAMIRLNGEKQNLGHFKTATEAKAAYDFADTINKLIHFNQSI